MRKIKLQNDTQPTSGGAVTAASKLLCKLGRTFPPPSLGARFAVFGQAGHAYPAGWLALLLTKAGDDETNPDPTTLDKQV